MCLSVAPSQSVSTTETNYQLPLKDISSIYWKPTNSLFLPKLMFITFDTLRGVSSLKYVSYGNIHLVVCLTRETAVFSLERFVNGNRRGRVL